MNVKKRLQQEVKDILPNDDVNNRIKQSLNILPEPQESKKVEVKEKRSFNWKTFGISLAAACVCLAICVSVFALVLVPGKTEVSNTYISLDINPSFSIETDKDNNVLSVKARNKDAAIVLFGLKTTGKNLNDVCNMIVLNSSKLGYITSDRNISILAVNDNADKENEVSNIVTSGLSEFIKLNNINTTVVDARANINAEDAKKNKTTIGKMAMAEYANKFNINNALDMEINDLINTLDNYSIDEINRVNKDLETKYEAIEDGIDDELDRLENIIDKAENYVDEVEDIIDVVKDKAESNINEAIEYYNNEISKLVAPDENFVMLKYEGNVDSNSFIAFIKKDYERLSAQYKNLEIEFEQVEDRYEDKLDSIKSQIKKDYEDDDDDDDHEDDDHEDDDNEENDD